MSYGLQIWAASGNLTYDSTLAVGGVCLGFFTIASGGSVFTFPDFITETGVAIGSRSGISTEVYTTDNALGYLRFTFNALCAGATVVLFAK